MVGITNIIPIFGPFIGAIPGVLLIFIEDPLKALEFLVIIVIIQQLDGNFIGVFGFRKLVSLHKQNKDIGMRLRVHWSKDIVVENLED